MNKVGSPTEDFHLISSRPCWAYTNSSSQIFMRWWSHLKILLSVALC